MMDMVYADDEEDDEVEYDGGGEESVQNDRFENGNRSNESSQEYIGEQCVADPDDLEQNDGTDNDNRSNVSS